MDKLTVVAWNAINGAPMVFEESALSVIAARDARIKELREALSAARDCILIDRAALADCHMDPLTNEVDEDGAAGVAAEYDVVLAQIGAALSKEA